MAEQSDFTNALSISQRLRQCLRFENPSAEESELERTAREAARELELLVEHCHNVEQWQKDGEAILGQQGMSAVFSLGAWWADRPWRKRGE